MNNFFFLILFIGLVSGCRSEKGVYEAVAPYTGKSLPIRGFDFGTVLDTIRSGEEAKLIYDDSLGIAFRLQYPDSSRAEVEYFGENDKLISIVINIYLQSEKKARRLYENLSDFISEELQTLPEGSFGSYQWNSDKVSYYIRMLPDRKTLSINAVKRKS